MNAPAETTPALVAVPLEQIALGKNYRHRRPANWEEKLDELGASMKQNGQLEPVLLRERSLEGERHFEVVFGERRYRAAKKAGLETLLAIVRHVPDDQVLELQLSENGDREDAHPLDEAEAFEALVKRGRTPAEIAATRGRDVGYVLKRLALLKLSKEVLAAFEEERLSFGVALLVARIPDKKLQEQALEVLEESRYDGPLTVAKASEIIEREFMLRLEHAPFDTADATLVPKAGPCNACPKRTGAQRELFADVKSPDLCTDPICHATKVDALWQIKKKEATKGGVQVVEGKEADAAGYDYGRGKYRKLDAQEWVGSKRVTIRKLLGKDLPPVALARNKAGEVFEVVPRADVEKLLKAKQPKEDRDDSGGGSDYAAAERRRAAKQKLKRKAITEAITAAVARAEERAERDTIFELVVRSFASRAWNEVQVGILERRGIKVKGNAEAALVKLAKDSEDHVLDGLALELALRSGAPWHGSSGPSGQPGLFAEGLKLFGVNFEAIEKRVAAEAKEKKGAKPKRVKTIDASGLELAPRKPKAKKAPKKRKAAR
jgi:ParB/RepB/Spo0J family partition protein